MQEILFLWCSFVIIQSQTHLHALDVKYYFPILMYQKCIPISYYTFHVPLWNSASRHRFLSQLNQFRLPVFCNEGVYRIVDDITHQKKNEFSGIIPLLGRFHYYCSCPTFYREVKQTRGIRWWVGGDGILESW